MGWELVSYALSIPYPPLASTPCPPYPLPAAIRQTPCPAPPARAILSRFNHTRIPPLPFASFHGQRGQPRRDCRPWPRDPRRPHLALGAGRAATTGRRTRSTGSGSTSLSARSARAALARSSVCLSAVCAVAAFQGDRGQTGRRKSPSICWSPVTEERAGCVWSRVQAESDAR